MLLHTLVALPAASPPVNDIIVWCSIRLRLLLLCNTNGIIAVTNA
jgi:hypothetical protein